jgi:hypothetical protein
VKLQLIKKLPVGKLFSSEPGWWHYLDLELIELMILLFGPIHPLIMGIPVQTDDYL